MAMGMSSSTEATSGGAAVAVSRSDTTSFISTWTVSGNEAARTVTLPLVQNNNAGSANTINFTIDWGDDTAIETIDAYNHADRTHIYGTNDTFTVTMSGTIQGLRFANGDMKAKIASITQWGSFNVTNNETFNGCGILTVSATDAPTITTTSFYKMFMSCLLLTGDFSTWDTSTVTNMDLTFYTCAYFNSPLADWDVSNVTTMEHMFRATTRFNQPLNDWDTTNVTDMGNMFMDCDIFNQNLNDWNVEKVTSMLQMFEGAEDFVGNVSGWNPTKSTTMYGMFNGCTNFNQNMSAWNFSDVTSFGNFLANTTLSTANYNALLVQINATNTKTNITFNGGNATADGVGETARNLLLARDPAWTITDGDS